MSETQRQANGAETGRVDARVEIYDPPMCCPTGMCGPTIDPVLVDVNEMVLNLKAEGVRVERYSLSSQPRAFFTNREVYRLVQERKLAALPITAVNGKVFKVGAYPTLDEVRAALNGSAAD
ncbi:MAG: arsenite efflux transporter metallochaperone ArsD [Firmicutes bacterium]|nr:arsenite efflux transporter metallochaperone ArsD [Bacillota bacterium]